MNPIVISLEGNIGSGKSTLIKLLKERISKWTYLFEPIEEWMKIKDENGKNILDLFYQDKKRWSYTFQNLAFFTRTNQLLKELSENKIIITERSVLTDKNVFSKILFDQNDMNKIEYNNYLMLIEMFNQKVKFHGHIYLKTDVNKTYERINKRSRESESEIKIEYLKKLNDYHDSWLQDKNNVLVLDGNNEFETNKEELDNLVKKIENFILRLFLENVGLNQLNTKDI